MLRDPALHARLAHLALFEDPDVALRAINTMAKYSQPLPRPENDQASRFEVYIGTNSKLGMERHRDEEERDDTSSDAETDRPAPWRKGQSDFQVTIGGEVVMGANDEEGFDPEN